MQTTTDNHQLPPQNHLYRKDFEYRHRNPYHDKLAIFDDFIMRDNQSEDFQGKWREDVFERSGGALSCEIGTGYGHFMREYCQSNPNESFVGLEYRFKRTYNLACKLAKLPYRNFRYLRARGERLEHIFAANELDNIFYFFPDPWPKKRHQKKRLFQAPFLKAAHLTLRKGGKLYVKTDHDDYYQWMLEELSACPFFEVELASWDLKKEVPTHFLSSYVTKFEKIFLKQNIKIKALTLVNKK